MAAIAEGLAATFRGPIVVATAAVLPARPGAMDNSADDAIGRELEEAAATVIGADAGSESVFMGTDSGRLAATSVVGDVADGAIDAGGGIAVDMTSFLVRPAWATANKTSTMLAAKPKARTFGLLRERRGTPGNPSVGSSDADAASETLLGDSWTVTGLMSVEEDVCGSDGWSMTLAATGMFVLLVSMRTTCFALGASVALAVFSTH